METNKYLIQNKRTGLTEEVTKEQQDNIKNSVYKRNFKYLSQAVDIGKVAPEAKTKKKTAKKED